MKAHVSLGKCPLAEGSTAARGAHGTTAPTPAGASEGSSLRQIGFVRPLGRDQAAAAGAHGPAGPDGGTLVVALLAGAKAVSHAGTTLRVDRPLQGAFGLPGYAEAVLAYMLDAATAQAVADLRQAVAAVFVRSRRTRQHASRTGRKLVRVRAAQDQETVWQKVLDWSRQAEPCTHDPPIVPVGCAAVSECARCYCCSPECDGISPSACVPATARATL